VTIEEGLTLDDLDGQIPPAWVKEVRREVWDVIRTSESHAQGPEAAMAAEVAVTCGQVIAELNELVREVCQRRAVAVRALDAEGLSRAQIGVALGLSRQRIQQILDR
jgi:DNA-directed RNA polymerase sigma subunit (sigma70/sigma32)